MSVDPLFKLHEDWEVLTLAEVCSRGGGNIQTGPFGSQLHAADYVDQGIPSIMPQNIGSDRISTEGIARITEVDAQRLEKYRVKAGDIVYSRRGDVERRALVREEHSGWLCGTGCLRVRFGCGHVHPEYASFYLSHQASRDWVVQHAVGATMPNLNTGILGALPFVLPPLDRQNEIATTLSALDDKIEMNRRVNETLEAMARAVFKDWFVDFGPTRRKAAGETDPVAILGGLLPDPAKAAELAALFPDSFGDNGLPEGWEPSMLAEIADLNPESWSAKNHPDEVEYIDLANTKWGIIESTTKYSWSDAPSRARRIVRDGDTVVGTVRPGNGSFSFVGIDGLTASTGFAVLRPRHKDWQPLVYCAATSSANIERLTSLADGGAYPAVRPDVVLNTPFPKVDELLYSEVGKVTKALFELIESHKQENQTLAATRDLLLPKLMSGEIRLKDAEAVD